METEKEMRGGEEGELRRRRGNRRVEEREREREKESACRVEEREK